MDNPSHWQAREISAALLKSMTELEMAQWRRREGHQILEHRGRYWEEVRRGFYQPIHWLARLTPEEATAPTPWCWGFRAVLAATDRSLPANGAMPTHLLTNLADYHPQNFSSKRKYDLRKCQKLVRFMELMGPALLQAQGYEVLASALLRTGCAQPPGWRAYQQRFQDYFHPQRRLVIAGLIDAKLGGYLEGFAVDGTAYIDEIIIATEALPSQIGTGLVVEFVQACQRAGNIREVVYGLHSREDTALCFFKDRIGFPVTCLPAKVKINFLVRKLIQWRYPHVYYRLTGTQ
ncbi:hypothetical protein DO97_09195 [Neosynechococcus sphagnicola sy1]|uniref:N-acetyltransferase domain-containing protein n=1 Tax=Neosynechococcus sphagnicola sy1 TaxID=1497020 RepID=A0A098TKJ9_9CYAN|nr:hypothetical protein [Neosynechococcus sphagnicola]KGF72377.1 hypothetical protein DO97_09195 [Neosynechococcus sphagnicola sy1]